MSEVELEPKDTTERLYRRGNRINRMIQLCSTPFILYHRLDNWQMNFILDIGGFRYLSTRQRHSADRFRQR